MIIGFYTVVQTFKLQLPKAILAGENQTGNQDGGYGTESKWNFRLEWKFEEILIAVSHILEVQQWDWYHWYETLFCAAALQKKIYFKYIIRS